MSASDFKELCAKGLKSLGGYYDTYKGTWPNILINEFKIRGVHLPVKIGGEKIDLLLKGALDKVEILDEKKVNVVDYKTGKAKSRNELEGKTKNADSNYKRQLVFYKLLLGLDEANRYEMKSGELDFTEPDEKMRYKKERFEITDEEVEELKKVVGRVASEIAELEFWDKTCDEKDCEYCLLRQHLR